MTATIELVHFDGCPHVEAARASLRDALKDEPGLRWIEWNLDRDDVPARLTRFPSPTVLVDGVPVGDVTPISPGARACAAAGSVTAARIRAALGL